MTSFDAPPNAQVSYFVQVTAKPTVSQSVTQKIESEHVDSQHAGDLHLTAAWKKKSRCYLPWSCGHAALTVATVSHASRRPEGRTF
ncbi:hypothetical protein OPT61_g9450 [Boeremia exigua]|uniref:Uncharacterized protein n=1 Tax=Boeremia exigua TaxID=749465 RepID=A0ACC2HU07_9PLEO|nr:hypothetical protein OPT61_g9450 [Boeremia exigua]